MSKSSLNPCFYMLDALLGIFKIAPRFVEILLSSGMHRNCGRWRGRGKNTSIYFPAFFTGHLFAAAAIAKCL